MGLGLSALIYLQYFYIRESYAQKAQIFDQTINSVMVDVVKKVEREEALQCIQQEVTKPYRVIVNQITANERIEKKTTKEPLRKETNKELAEEAKKKVTAYALNNTRSGVNIISTTRNDSSGGFSLRIETPVHTAMVLDDMQFNLPLSLDSLNVTLSQLQLNKDSIVILSRAKDRLASYTLTHRSIPAPPAPPSVKELDSKVRNFMQVTSERKDKVKIFEELATQMQVQNLPLRERVNVKVVDSLLQLEFRLRSVNIPYQMSLVSDKNDSLIFRTAGYREDYNPALYRINLFEGQNNTENAVMSLYFPDKQQRLLAAVWPILLSSSLLVIIISFCFAYTIHSILKQKKITELKNDFINNMTHEFKTPVTTIMLASEALKDPDVARDESRLSRMAGIIYEENNRMAEHVEQVLNMARMDRGEVCLDMAEVNVHDLIDGVLDKMSLQLNAKSMTINRQLYAEHFTLMTDEMHLGNVIMNLLDNAIKYSPQDTEITIRTRNAKGIFECSIIDQGIGMKKEQVKKIFEAFYRVPTGNIHNVKGFGIGLHYVYTILKKMKGRITVKSEPGSGTDFTVSLELNS